MELFEQVKELLKLDAENPEFKCKFTLMKDKLLNFRSDKKKEMEEATELIRQLNLKGSGELREDIGNAYANFNSCIVKRTTDEPFLYRTSIKEILEARKVAHGFIKTANQTINKQMHKYHNDYALQYCKILAKKFVDAYKNNDESYWTYYYKYKRFTMQAVSKGTLSINKFPDLAKIIRVMENKINEATDKVSSLEKLDVFSNANTIQDRINLKRIVSEMICLSVTDLDKMIEYYNKTKNELDAKLYKEEITTKEYNQYNGVLVSEYNALLAPDKTNELMPLLTFQSYMGGSCEVYQLLEYSEEEMINAYRLAHMFIKYFTNKQIEDMVIDLRKLSVTSVKFATKATKSMLNVNSRSLLDLLLSYNIITPEQYEKDLIILQEG